MSLEAIVELDRARPALGEQLTSALRRAISDGRLAPGVRLPASRVLADDLRLSRGVVVDAYEQLIAEGRLVARRGSGTRVSDRPESGGGGSPGTGTPDTAPTVTGSGRPGRPGASAPRYAVLDQLGLPHKGLLRPGVPDLGMFPRRAWRRAYEKALAEASDADLDYIDPAGPWRLRQGLADYLGRVRAAVTTADAVTVTAGVAQGLGLIAAALRQGGSTAIGLEDPGSVGVRDHLSAYGMELVPVPVDADGLRVDALRRTGVRAVVVTPAHQFPSGVVLAPARRAELIAWARRSGALIVEDDYDAEFRYDRDPVGCVQGAAPDVVAYVGSVSKALAPGLRLGWLAVPPQLRPAVAAAKAAADLGGPILDRLAFAEFLSNGSYDRHLRRSRRAQRQRRDAVLRALARHLPQARVTGVAAGLHLVAELPAGVDDVALVTRARAAGLAPLPLSALRMAAVGPPGLVIGYAASSPDEVTEAVRTIAGLW